MHTIAELNMLVRARVKLPVGFKLATEKFLEGWNFVRCGGAQRLERKVATHGWNFIGTADGSLRSGVGATSQQAIAAALKLALRRISEHFNAAEVERIELTEYPWFFLARVRVYPYLIQQGAVLPISDAAPSLAVTPAQRRLPSDSAELFPEFGSAMPMLKELLIASRGSQARVE